MPLRENQDGYWMADLRVDGGPRLSTKTKDRSLARLLYREIEQLHLKGEKVDAHVVKALTSNVLAMQRATTMPGVPQVLAAPAQPVAEPRPTTGVTLREAFELAMIRRDEWRDSRNPKTIRENFRHVCEFFGGETRLLASITSSDTINLKDQLLAQGKSASTINQRMSLLSVLYEVIDAQFAITRETKFAISKPRFWRVPPGKPSYRIMSLSEEARVVRWFSESTHPYDAHMLDLTLCLLDTGFRHAEMLRVVDGSDIEWETGMLAARETKSGKDRRVEMSERVRDTLRRRVRSVGVAPFAGMDVRFNDKRWQAMRAGIGLGDDSAFVIHTLRHTCCTRMILAGVNPFKVMNWMGHASITTTQIYVTLCGADMQGLSKVHDDAAIRAIEVHAEAHGGHVIRAAPEGKPTRLRNRSATVTDC